MSAAIPEAENFTQGAVQAPAPAAAASGETFARLLDLHAADRGARPAWRHKDRGVWQTWTWAETRRETRAMASGLAALGVKRGDSISIIGFNRPRLYWAVMAAHALGATPAPVYADAVADELAFVCAHAGARFAVVQDQEQVDKLLAVADQLPELRGIIYDEPRGLRDYDHGQLHDLDQVMARGRERLAAQGVGGEAWLDAEIAAGRGADLSVILYTSGTTGRSKGVMISHERAVAAARSTCQFDRLDEREEVLAYLPLAWVGDHYLTFAQAMVAGFCVCCPESADTVTEDLREIGPTYYFAPPRVLESLLTRITIRMQDAGRFKQWLYRRCIAVARRHGEAILEGRPTPVAGRLAYALGEALIYGPLKNTLGFSKIRVAYTAGEAIGPELFSWYRSLGINLKQLYGQTEAFLFVTAQPDGRARPDTVGPPAPGVDLRIADDGEVQFRSPGMFTGYFREDDKTREAMTPDGWVKTGDAGFFTSDGDLKIIDRAKDVGRLAGGALFAPKYIENRLKFYPNIKEVVAFGDGRADVACFVNIDLTAVAAWAERNNVVYATYQELAAHPQVAELLRQDIVAANAALAQEEAMAPSQVRRFIILHKELDPDDGELTRTQKVRRGFIAERYAPLVRALYDGSAEADITTEVTFEDGRKGQLSARLRVHDLDGGQPRAASRPAQANRGRS